ncbi:MAG: M48 family metallopeptidase [Pirellulaceae bacterium]|nr:M48 family metallopeptidase [Planctomycetales bacterium]
MQTIRAMWFVRRHMFGAVLCLLALDLARVATAQPADPAAAMQQMFDEFARASNAFMPGILGELTDEQVRQLEGIDIPIQDERRFGERVVEEYLATLRSNGLVWTEEGRDVEYLSQLVAKIRPLMERGKLYREIRVIVVESPTTDAYSVPGGTLIFSTGMVQHVANEAAMVGVLGHELSHLDRGHQLLPLRQAKMMRQPMSLDRGMSWIGLFARPFRPEFEKQADADATRWMMQLGYEPLALSRLLSSWDRRQDQQVPWQKFVPSFVKSHPDPGLRSVEIARLSEQLRQQYVDATYIGEDNLRERRPRDGGRRKSGQRKSERRRANRD